MGVGVSLDEQEGASVTKDLLPQVPALSSNDFPSFGKLLPSPGRGSSLLSHPLPLSGGLNL